ncbi:hypothetical protein M8998_06220 [Sphingobacterium sp. lm-10]|uniref:hypothetical protein n=1 Tax=Sphingobacterium sp. lm-10 TaxID=2944904 RepID=UPI0020211E2E|nr:hypothetical protein [Sphingobacterium sp. lm-10]MCL7987528.1 hypothetical protein [Sphingobacterium sp. lm-10]
MFKILIIGALLGILLYYSFRRLKRSFGLASVKKSRPGYIALEVDSADTKRAIRSTAVTVGTGGILLLIILLLGLKIKILLILLPIALYLIGQIFLLANQMNAIRRQKVWFNPQTSDLWIEDATNGNYSVNVYRDITAVKTVGAIQQNRDVFFGYYELITTNGFIRLPSLLSENRQNTFFFDTLRDGFDIKPHRALFPLL